MPPSVRKTLTYKVKGEIIAEIKKGRRHADLAIQHHINESNDGGSKSPYQTGQLMDLVNYFLYVGALIWVWGKAQSNNRLIQWKYTFTIHSFSRHAMLPVWYQEDQLYSLVLYCNVLKLQYCTLVNRSLITYSRYLSKQSFCCQILISLMNYGLGYSFSPKFNKMLEFLFKSIKIIYEGHHGYCTQ